MNAELKNILYKALKIYLFWMKMRIILKQKMYPISTCMKVEWWVYYRIRTTIFPLPPIVHDVNANMQQAMIATTLRVETEPTNVDTIGPIYAPISMLQFHRPFSKEEFFMIKLCSLCDKANVAHHIMDDIGDLLRECQRNEIDVQPEQLRKRVHVWNI